MAKKTFKIDPFKDSGHTPDAAGKPAKIANYSIEDKKNVINYHKKKAADPTYKMKGFEKDSIMRQYGKKV